MPLFSRSKLILLFVSLRWTLEGITRWATTVLFMTHPLSRLEMVPWLPLIFLFQLCFLCTFGIHYYMLYFRTFCLVMRRNNTVGKLRGTCLLQYVTCLQYVPCVIACCAISLPCSMNTRLAELKAAVLYCTSHKWIHDPPKKVRTTTTSPSILNLGQWQNHHVSYRWFYVEVHVEVVRYLRLLGTAHLY